MNGPVRMYRTKPIIRHDSPVELPKCMYRMRSVHVVATPPPPKPDITEQVKQFLKVSLFSFLLSSYSLNDAFNLPVLTIVSARKRCPMAPPLVINFRGRLSKRQRGSLTWPLFLCQPGHHHMFFHGMLFDRMDWKI